ncbi:hypothetical protein Ahy_A08g038586 [Arachis hypogaea]|uniref:Aminotransferase-like plant mobile domain-containing protein n=1 Tax=Arachis hypogaea TaxID=3818 RepID=A0A445BU30_ARAHY|nr:hypothetical protein Ahy_A08g038586 [Arachis hypogaea]
MGDFLSSRLDYTEHITGRLDRVPRGQTVLDEVDCETHLIPQQLIGGILFLDASDSRVHIRWLPLLEDLDACGRLSWSSTVLARLYRQMCRATEHGQRNLGGCVNLMLSWAYHRIPLVRPDGFDARSFPVSTTPCNQSDSLHLLVEP